MSDEIKENNTPNHILSALGDLTNGAINYYQLPKTTLEEQKMILDYITNLQTIEREYSSLLSENAELQQENDRLNNIINELEKYIMGEIDDAQEELNLILQGNDLDYKNECTKEFNCIKKALDMLLEKLKELKENK